MPLVSISLREKLKLKNFKLNTLLEVTNAINANLPKKELVRVFKETLTEKLNIGKAMLYLFDERWSRELSYGTGKKRIAIHVSKDLGEFERITVLNNHENERLNQFDVIVPIFHNAAPLAYLLLGDLDGEKIEVSPIIKHLPFIQTLTNVITVAIENKRLQQNSLKQAAIKKELELASKMQAMLIPNELPHTELLDVGAFYKPHQEVGGDYYDFVQVNKDEIAFCIADVSGKGVSAAILMSNFQGNIRALMEASVPLREVVLTLNDRVMASAKGEKFITLFIARYNLKTRKLTYINAGHNPPIVLMNGKISELKEGCTIIGMFEEIPNLSSGEVKLAKDAVIVTYTDGVTEIENNEGEQFGTERLSKVILKNQDKSTEKILQKVFFEIEKHRGRMNYVDDIALLGCRFR